MYIAVKHSTPYSSLELVVERKNEQKKKEEGDILPIPTLLHPSLDKHRSESLLLSHFSAAER